MGGTKRSEETLTEEGREQGREENFKGGITRRAQASVQYSHKPLHSLALRLWYYK